MESGSTRTTSPGTVSIIVRSGEGIGGALSLNAGSSIDANGGVTSMKGGKSEEADGGISY